MGSFQAQTNDEFFERLYGNGSRPSPFARMTAQELQALLEEVRAGKTSPSDAARRVQNAMSVAPFDDLGFARVDTHRHLRQGFPEVILGTGKTPAQIAAIAGRISASGQSLLVTRASREAYDAVRATVPDAEYRE